ncbi:hypothetical protein F2Q69_00051242 [Brassica cretica]|uniref:Uncharacterized protein n=1 Tax=Brassica cretica TaxID=69181 RepID=A0A8S9PZS8_BRACR|nr:hypothetical protein F2Q69_00051242 [Brassica cretica]
MSRVSASNSVNGAHTVDVYQPDWLRFHVFPETPTTVRSKEKLAFGSRIPGVSRPHFSSTGHRDLVTTCFEKSRPGFWACLVAVSVVAETLAPTRFQSLFIPRHSGSSNWEYAPLRC